MDQKESVILYERARQAIPAGVNSNTRARRPHPLYYRRAQGAELWDVDGNRYLDIMMGNGAVLLGHGEPRVREAVAKALESGLTIGVEWDLAVAVAERFLALVPGMDLVRLANSGTEAVLHALQLARFATGRERIAKIEGSLHGWTEEGFSSVWPDVAKAGPPESMVPQAGSPGFRQATVDSLLVMPFNDVERSIALIERHADELAAVILEPVLINVGFIPPRDGYLEALRQVCTKHGIVLVFDEILTGLSLAPGGAQEVLGVVPDLATYGKALGNGYPIAALAGREDLMRLTEPGNGPVYVGTFNGHAMSVAAAGAALDILAGGEVQRQAGIRNERLRRSFAAAARAAGIEAHMAGGGFHFHWYFTSADVRDYRSAATTNAAANGAFVSVLAERGVLCLSNPLSHHALSLAHDEPVLDRLEEAFEAGLKAASRV